MGTMIPILHRSTVDKSRAGRRISCIFRAVIVGMGLSMLSGIVLRFVLWPQGIDPVEKATYQYLSPHSLILMSTVGEWSTALGEPVTVPRDDNFVAPYCYYWPSRGIAVLADPYNAAQRKRDWREKRVTGIVVPFQEEIGSLSSPGDMQCRIEFDYLPDIRVGGDSLDSESRQDLVEWYPFRGTSGPMVGNSACTSLSWLPCGLANPDLSVYVGPDGRVDFLVLNARRWNWFIADD